MSTPEQDKNYGTLYWIIEVSFVVVGRSTSSTALIAKRATLAHSHTSQT
jgi:hypothetical protein